MVNRHVVPLAVTSPLSLSIPPVAIAADRTAAKNRSLDRRRGVSHQRQADLRGPHVAGAQDRRPAAQQPDGAGHFRRPESRDGRALGLSRHGQVGRGAQHARVRRRDAGVAASTACLAFTINLQGGSPQGYSQRSAVAQLGHQRRRQPAAATTCGGWSGFSTRPTSWAWS